MSGVRNQEHGVAAAATLSEPTRRRIYLYVIDQQTPVGKDTVAAAAGVPRSVAAFHLDKLVAVGLLRADYRRLPGRGGPGAGRPAKLYTRSDQEVSVSFPERRYDLAARVLAKAVEASGQFGQPVTHSLNQAARDCGRQLVADNVGHSARPLRSISKKEALERLAGVLAAQGYEPRLEGDSVRLGNCPFHALAEDHRQLVCTMNLELVKGAAQEAGLPETAAQLLSSEDGCCVVITG